MPLKAVLTAKERNQVPRDIAGQDHGLKCVTFNPKGRAWWGPWGAPDEYVYGGANSKFVRPTGSINDSEWVQDISWKGRVGRELKIKNQHGIDEDRISHMREFLRFAPASRGAWQSVYDSKGVEEGVPDRRIAPPTPVESQQWLQGIQGPMRTVLTEMHTATHPPASSGTSRSRSSCGYGAQKPRSVDSGSRRSVRSRSVKPRAPFLPQSWRCPQGSPVGMPLEPMMTMQRREALLREVEKLRSEKPHFGTWTHQFFDQDNPNDKRVFRP